MMEVASKLGVMKKNVTTKMRWRQMKEVEKANNGKGRRGEGSSNEVRLKEKNGGAHSKN